MLQDHTPIPIEQFNGLYGIDSYEDSVPPTYFINELNTITYGSELRTRDGFGLSLETLPITKFAIYRRQGESARKLALIGTNIVDLTTGITILAVAGMTDFAIGFFNNRAFISPHNGIAGLPGSFVYVYNGTGVARKAAGNKPVAGFTVAWGATGVIETGIHIFSWVFETDSGFVTAPGPAQIIDMDGVHKVSFVNVPVGPTGTAARRLIASRAIQDYNGDEEGYEMFFVSGARIANNVSTIYADVDFYDVDLQFSADYTYDQLEEIPAVVFISPYGNKMGYGGPDVDKNLVYISKSMEPESIHSSAGFASFDPFETEGVKDATEFRDNYYVTKRNKTYVIRDNTFEPSTWKPITLDSSIGSDVNGIAKFWDTTGSKVDWFVVNSPGGIYKFTGVYDELAITRNIRKIIWDRINKEFYNKNQIIFDQERMLLYVLLCLDASEEPSHILVCNYENGFQLDRIKWHLWEFEDFTPNCIGIDRNTNKKTVLKVAANTGNIYAQEENRRYDDESIITNTVKFALIGEEPNAIHHYGAVGFRIMGSGVLNLRLEGQDGVDNQDLPSLNLTCFPGKEFIALAHFQSEKASIVIRMDTPGAYFKLKRINLYTNIIFNSRPLV